MSAFVILGVLAALIVAELYSVRTAKSTLHTVCETDLALAEPDGTITMTVTVTNSSAIPRLFVRVWFFFAEGARLEEDAKWIARYRDRDYPGLCVHRNLSLMPHTTARFRVRFSLRDRGVVSPGHYVIECGDFLGFYKELLSGKAESPIVVTARPAPDAEEALHASGLLGSVSVRRFLHDDPSLAVGFRDYTGHEPMKQIAWKQTARRGSLMVRENDHTAEPSATLLVDLSGYPAENEAVLSLTRSISELLEDRKVPYALYSNGDLFSTGSGIGEAHIREILERIGRARPTAFRSVGDLAEEVLEEQGLRGDLLLIAPEPNRETEACLAWLAEQTGNEAAVCYGSEHPLTQPQREEAKEWTQR